MAFTARDPRKATQRIKPTAISWIYNQTRLYGGFFHFWSQMDKTALIIQLIGTQDVRKWDEVALLQWATKMATLIINANS